MVAGLLGYLIPNSVTINGKTRQLDETELLIHITVGLISLIIFFIVNRKFVVVDLGGNKVTINNFTETIEAKWTEVESVNMIPFVHPPLYKIRLKNNSKTYLFTTQPNFFRMENFVVDMSDMGNRIRKMKKELQL
ncbi:hypothetical protein [Jiulongibacter sediminis]|uniref:hypothetical protein n=1 Tax=Jiulongibacter sediminis TaxID=1605367 RepID=UPI0026EFB16C|nr:hypothetical protein [Jiulongibacter sediminis]